MGMPAASRRRRARASAAVTFPDQPPPGRETLKTRQDSKEAESPSILFSWPFHDNKINISVLGIPLSGHVQDLSHVVSEALTYPGTLHWIMAPSIPHFHDHCTYFSDRAEGRGKVFLAAPMRHKAVIAPELSLARPSILSNFLEFLARIRIFPSPFSRVE